MRNRDEISAGTADEWRDKFLEQAKAMEKEQIMDAYRHDLHPMFEGDAEQYYNEKYVNHESKKV